MKLVQLSKPDAEAINYLNEVAPHLKVEAAQYDQPYIQQAAVAATQRLDGQNGMLGRCLIAQRWKLTTDLFPDQFHIPLPPTISVEAVKYLDIAGDEQTLAAQNYSVQGLGALSGATIIPAKGEDWPSTWDFPGAVSVEFTAGFGETSDDIPSDIRIAIAQLTAHFYENREAVSTMAHMEVPLTVQDVVDAYKVWRT